MQDMSALTRREANFSSSRKEGRILSSTASSAEAFSAKPTSSMEVKSEDSDGEGSDGKEVVEREVERLQREVE
jgi:hypothetical protein